MRPSEDRKRAADTARVFLCFAPDQQVCADRIDSWPHTNADRDAYNGRLAFRLDAVEADTIRSVIRAQIGEADVVICVIGPDTNLDEWIGWELTVAKSGPSRTGLVGVLLHEHDPIPPAMADSGAIFVPFKRDAIERAVEWALTETYTSDDYTLLDED